MSKADTQHCEADTAKPTLNTAKPILDLTSQLTRSLRRPTSRTLRLIEKALDWLRPFESAQATATKAERMELLELLTAHRPTLSPYIDTDRIESHLRHV